jgi:hypothetical protein
MHARVPPHLSYAFPASFFSRRVPLPKLSLQKHLPWQSRCPAFTPSISAKEAHFNESRDGHIPPLQMSNAMDMTDET